MSNKSFFIRALGLIMGRKHVVSSNVSNQHSTRKNGESTDTISEEKHTSDEGQTANSSVSMHSNQTVEETTFTPTSIMHALGVEILEDGGEGYYLIGFQGGVFVFSFEEDRLNVMYNDVVECSYEDTIKASLVANEVNSSYAVWTCYLRTVPKGSNNLPVKVCFSQMFPLKGDFNKLIDFIHGVLSSAFAVGRDFRERFVKAQKDQSNLANTLIRKDFIHKLDLAKRLMEVRNYDKIKDEMPPASYLRIDTLADLFDDTEFGNPTSMKILANNQLELVTNAQEVTNFDIRSYVRDFSQREELVNLTLVATFEKQDLIISLKRMPGSSAKSLFFALNVMRSGVEDDILSHNRAMISCRDTVEIRLTTEQEDYWEVKYMVDEARDKHEKNDISSLTNEQKMMLIQLFPNVQDDLYWGFKFFNQDCLFQSLFYFKRIYYNYCKPEYQNKRAEDIKAEISLYIGIIYFQLKRYELAFYYLDRSNKYESIVASEWYTNCLCYLKDSRAYNYIRRMIETVSHNIEDIEPDSKLREDLITFYLFLKRRLLQTLITDLRLAEAENLAIKMIKSHENEEFCRNELKKIRELRREEAEDNSVHDIDNEDMDI